MRKIKKILLIVFTILALLAIVFFSFVFFSSDENLGYYLSNGRYTASGYKAYPNESVPTKLTIPSMHNGIPITKIDTEAFTNNSTIKEVVISEGLENIGACAFQNCVSLQCVTLTKSIKEIGPSAFRDCPNLDTVIFNGTVDEWNACEKGIIIFLRV